MRATARVSVLLLACLLALAVMGPGASKLPPVKFNGVKEIAPGVFFRYSALDTTHKTLPFWELDSFGGSNNIWIVFEDYVVVIDANFPREAADVIAAIKKTTDRPIRYVLDTHHHGDHAYGNAVFAKAGASIISQANCAGLLRRNGAGEFQQALQTPTGFAHLARSQLKVPDIVFEDKLVLDDGTQRVEFLFFGHAHTAGDTFVYLPKHKILCTGDACVNGAFDWMGDSDSASWIRAQERAEQLDVKIVCPGHGPLAGKDLLAKHTRYFVELRRQVQEGIDAGKRCEEIRLGLHMPWYREWTGVDASTRKDNVEHVYDELTGRIMPPDLLEDFDPAEGTAPRLRPGWTRPERIVVNAGLMPARLAELKQLAPEVAWVPVKTEEDAVREVARGADAVLGFLTPDIIRAGERLRWAQVDLAGVPPAAWPVLAGGSVVVTSPARLSRPAAAERAFAFLLALTHSAPPQELHGKTMLVVGLDGAGRRISRVAHALGMRVRVIDSRNRERPDYVLSLDEPARLLDLLPEVGVVVLTGALTPEADGRLGARELRAMKRTAYLINVGRASLVHEPSLAAAVEEKRLAGAGLDETDPQTLPDDQRLRKLPNVLVSPHPTNASPDGAEWHWRLWRENVRRFVAGEPLLGVVDKQKGY
jgi:cyclase